MPITSRILFAQKSRGGPRPPENARSAIFTELDASERQDIHSALERFACDRNLKDTRTWSPIWTVSKPRSVVLLAQLADDFPPVIVKRQRAQNRDLAAQMLLRESRYHELAYSATCADKECALPKVLAIYPSFLVQIMEYVEGATLLALLFHAGSYSGKGRLEVLNIMHRIGRWLRSVADKLKIADTRVEPSEIVDDLLQKWDETQRRYPSLTRSFPRSPFSRWLETERDQLDADGLAAINCHGDFAPGNILVRNGSELIVLDFASGTVGTRLQDACYFLHQLWHFEFNPLVSRAFLSDARNAFLQGLGQEYLTPAPLYRLERARQYMASLYNIHCRRQRRGLLSRAHDRWFARACIRELQRLSSGSCVQPQ